MTVQTLRDKGYEPLAYRYLCLTAHYRTQLEFTFESLDSAVKSLENLRALCRQAKAAANGAVQDTPAAQAWKAKFSAAMEDDLNAPRALAVAWEAARSAELSAAEKVAVLQFADSILALDLFKEIYWPPAPPPAPPRIIKNPTNCAAKLPSWATR